MTNKIERGLAPELLQSRSDAIIASYRKMFDAGLSPDTLRAIEAEYPREHRDMLQVFLGLKPVAGFLQTVIPRFLQEDNYLSFFPGERQLGIEVMSDVNGCVWNPKQVEKIFRDTKNREAVLAVNSFGEIPHPRSMFFSQFLAFVSRPDIGEQPIFLAGLLYGYPRRSSLLFSKYRGLVLDAVGVVAEKAAQKGLQHSLPDTTSIAAVVENREGLRDEFMRVANLVGFQERAVIAYIESLRYSQTPGFPYVTSGPVTREETSWIQLYNASGLERKLTNLLS